MPVTALLLLLRVAHRVGDLRVRSPAVRVCRHLRVALLPLLLAEGHRLLPTRQTVTYVKSTSIDLKE